MGERSGLLSVDTFNHGPAGLVSVVPLTTKNRGLRSHVEIQPPGGGLTEVGYAMSEQLRAISKDRLESRIGAVSRDALEAVDDCVRILLGL